ncbi:MAG: hypothetical protein GY866_08790 [Proteobacteria bacterium]|nr:hypothetical protein [Pseudomonadota bacterium]
MTDNSVLNNELNQGDRVLPFFTKFSYGVGQMSEGIKNSAFGTFLLLFYNQVLGVSGTLVGTAIFVALCFDAVTDPIVGSISDSFKSRWGRRHPFMYASSLPFAVTFYFLFAPFSGLSEVALFVWVMVLAIVIRTALTLYHVPHLALGAELSSNYLERTSIVAWRSVFSIVGSVLVSLLGYTVFFVDSNGVSGDLVKENYAPFALTLSAIMLVSMLWTALGTHKQIPYLLKPKHLSQGQGMWTTMKSVVADVRSVLRNRSFKWVATASLSAYIMVGAQGALTLYIANYFWELTGNEKLALLLSVPLGLMLGASITRSLHIRVDKRATLIGGSCCYALFQVAPVLLRLSGFFPGNDSALLLPILVICGVIAGIGGVQIMITSGSMMADVADEHELETHRRQEGIFFGTLSFAAKAASGMGMMMGGVALDLIEFPRQAAVGEVPQDVVFNLGAVFSPMVTTFAIVGLWCLTHYNLTHRRHAEILRKLDQRNKEHELN